MKVYWGKPHLFCLPWIDEILGFSKISVYTELPCSNPFHNTLNCASTANIEEVMKFYNPDDKSFETD